MTKPETEIRSTPERAARLMCLTCGGRKQTTVVPWDSNGVPFGPFHDPCPDCRDTEGSPTGLSYWELSESCHHYLFGATEDSGWVFDDPDWEFESDPHDGPSSCNCHGTGRVVRLDRNALDSLMFRVGIDQLGCVMNNGAFTFQYAGPKQLGGIATRESIDAACFDAAMKVLYSLDSRLRTEQI